VHWVKLNASQGKPWIRWRNHKNSTWGYKFTHLPTHPRCGGHRIVHMGSHSGRYQTCQFLDKSVQGIRSPGGVENDPLSLFHWLGASIALTMHALTCYIVISVHCSVFHLSSYNFFNSRKTECVNWHDWILLRTHCIHTEQWYSYDVISILIKEFRISMRRNGRL